MGAEKAELKTRSLTREIGYRTHLRMIYFGSIPFILVLGFSLFKVTKDLVAMPETFHYGIFFLVFATSVVSAILVFLFILRKQTTESFHVFPDKVTIRRAGKSIDLNYSDIEKVRFAHIPYFSGVMTVVLKNGESHKFSTSIERSEYIADSIYSFNKKLCAKDQLESYRRAALIIDHSAHRFEKRLKKIRRIFLKYLIYPTGVMLIFTLVLREARAEWVGASDLLSNYILFVLSHVALGLLIFSFFEYYIMAAERKKLLKNPNDVRVDTDDEKKKEIWCQFLYFAISPLLIFVFSFLMLVQKI